MTDTEKDILTKARIVSAHSKMIRDHGHTCLQCGEGTLQTLCLMGVTMLMNLVSSTQVLQRAVDADDVFKTGRVRERTDLEG